MPHAGRSRRPDAPDRSPQWHEVQAARLAAGLTPAAAARAVFTTTASWERWEANPASTTDARRMPAASWWLFRLRTGQAQLADLPPLDPPTSTAAE